MAWTQLFLKSLGAAGLQPRANNYVIITPAKTKNVPGFSTTGLMIDFWNFNGTGSNNDPASKNAYPYVNEVPPGYLFMTPPPAGQEWAYTWVGNPDVTDSAGIPGQNTTNPHSLFGNHIVALLDGKYYDPSYGRKWNSLPHFDDSAVAGFYALGQLFPGTANNKPVLGFRQNPTGLDLDEEIKTYNPRTGQFQ